MKKLLFIPMLMLSMLSMAACGDSGNDSVPPEAPEQPENPGTGDDGPDTPAPGGNRRYLVLYCSRSGNTERMAQQIRSTLDCDMLKVEPFEAYENDYDAMLDRAQSELAAIGRGDFPPIRTSMENFDGYELIFVGYPIWYGSMATPMQTFLHEHAAKLTGKRIALFATSGSTAIGESVGEARALCAGAAFTETLYLASSLSGMEARVAAWLETLGARREENNNSSESMKVNITVGSRTITATMEDNAAGRDFLSRLPLEVTLEDYNDITEKIFYPSPALTTAGVTRGCAPTPGDITIYVPWGNVAIFCKSWSQSDDLIKIGRIDGDGIGVLSVAGDVAVRFERQESVAPPQSSVEGGDLVRIDAGTFTMGSPADERWRETDEVQHEVTLRSYLIGRHEVTQAQYSAATGSNPSYHRGDNLPVEMVSWYDAVRYCNALSEREGLTAAYTIDGDEVTWNREADGYRLPTEAEWEYACRAGTTSPFTTGRNITVEQSNWYSSYPYIEGEGGGAYRSRTVDTDEFEPNAWGLFNMHGNVSEWCWDRYGAYGAQPQTDPAGAETGRNRVARGGGWYDYAKHVRSAYRSVAPPDYTDYKRGFRVARNADRR